MSDTEVAPIPVADVIRRAVMAAIEITAEDATDRAELHRWPADQAHLLSVIGEAVHAALCSRCSDVGSGLTIRSLDMERVAPAVRDALDATGYMVVPPLALEDGFLDWARGVAREMRIDPPSDRPQDREYALHLRTLAGQLADYAAGVRWTLAKEARFAAQGVRDNPGQPTYEGYLAGLMYALNVLGIEPLPQVPGTEPTS